MSISILYRNILENSTVTVTNEDTDFPKWRLYDRDIGKLFKGTGTADHTIKADQGATTQYDVDTLIIPAGHSLTSGDLLDWEHSTNDSTWVDMVTAWAGASGQIVKEAVASQNKRYWRLVLTSLAALPEIPELWMGEKLTISSIVYNPSVKEGTKGNVFRTDSISGHQYMLIQGEERAYKTYHCLITDQTTKTNLDDFLTVSRGKPFWLKDLDGTWFFMSLVDPNIGIYDRKLSSIWEIDLEMIQVLA